MNRGFLRNGIVTLVLVVGVATLLYVVLLGPSQNAKTIPYAGGTDSFQALVKAGQVANVTQQGTDLQITLTSTNPDGTQKLLESQVPGTLGEGLTSDVATWCAQGGATCNNQMTITAVPESQTGSWIGLLLTTALPLILIGAILFYHDAPGPGHEQPGHELRQEPRPDVHRQQADRSRSATSPAWTRPRRSSRKSSSS